MRSGLGIACISLLESRTGPLKGSSINLRDIYLFISAEGVKVSTEIETSGSGGNSGKSRPIVEGLGSSTSVVLGLDNGKTRDLNRSAVLSKLKIISYTNILRLFSKQIVLIGFCNYLFAFQKTRIIHSTTMFLGRVSPPLLPVLLLVTSISVCELWMFA